MLVHEHTHSLCRSQLHLNSTRSTATRDAVMMASTVCLRNLLPSEAGARVTQAHKTRARLHMQVRLPQLL